ncbi:hypothetical protein B0J17DRAFT_772987 [Rhizoctonia solani]|nr:hypothetical protein B0J17DRAFT_772987 [Rhizoctonia solani]
MFKFEEMAENTVPQAAQTHLQGRQPSYMSDESKSHPLPDTELAQGEVRVTSIRKGWLTAWVQTIWALVVYFILSVGATLFVVLYVKDRNFNVKEHFAPVEVADGTRNLPFTPLQAEVVTILSSMIVAQKSGLRRRDFKTLVKYRVLTPSTWLKNLPTFIIGTLLFASLAANLSSLILSGSISWVPMHRGVPGLSVGPVNFADVEPGFYSELPDYYRNNSYERGGSVANSAGVFSIAWTRNAEKEVLKRVAVLVRSYSGAWNVLNLDMSIRFINSSYIPPREALVDSINQERVYAWLGIQLFVTLLSIIFLVLQSILSKYPLMGDNALTAFYLNTTGVNRNNNGNPFKTGAVKITQTGDLLGLVEITNPVERESRE